MKKINKVLLLTALAAVGTGALSSCSFINNSQNKEKVSYVNVNINPDLELIVDSDNKVVKVIGSNQDARVLLYGEANLEGLDIEVAIDKIVDLSVEMGYLTEENHTVSTQVTSHKNSVSSDLLNKINTQISVSAGELDFEVKTTADHAFSLVREYQGFIEEHPTLENKLTIDEFNLALRASQTGEVTIDAAVTMDTQELITLINENTDKAINYTTEAFEQIRATQEAIYEKAETAVENLEFTKFYTGRILSHPTTAYHGSLYQIYNLSYHTVNALIHTVEAVQSIGYYELDEAKVSEILTELDIQNVTVEDLKGIDGKITIASVEEYLNKLFKNNEEYQVKKAQMVTKMNQVVASVKLELGKVAEKYSEEIQTIVTECESIIASIKTIMPASLHAVIDAHLDAFVEIKTLVTTKVADHNLTLQDLEEIKETLKVKVQEVKVEIESDLTDEEKAELAQKIEKAKEALAVIKAKCDLEINKAEQSAKAYIAELKEKQLAKVNQQ